MGERDWIWNKREDGISIRISGTRVLLGKFVMRRFERDDSLSFVYSFLRVRSPKWWKIGEEEGIFNRRR